MAFSPYIDAFTDYLRTGDTRGMNDYCVDATQLKRLAVYRNGFYKGCIDALAANFPVCEKSLGREYFNQLARLYVDHYPPEIGTLVGYGEYFPYFIRDLLEVLEQQESMRLSASLVDLARLDYAWLTSLMSADATQTLTAEKITWLVEHGEDFTQAQVTLSASVDLLRVNAGTLNQWLGFKTNSPDVEPLVLLPEGHMNLSELSQADSAPAVDTVMFWRLNDAVQARLLSVPEVALMRALQDVGVLEKAFAAALALDPSFDVSEVFSACLQNEILDIDLTKYNYKN
ncbi:DNA-binding domain-containing protein [Amphritea sp. 1_MG-2023]|uniref:HvfC/BufC N-terminal domain-containing protein n=1 Tax=Amphritea sp. 1_MG-2023 TaxID=3062670 RepID=UPI0026E2B37D|nr:DNA-binding domain-containing protein [Amphritea sp. 1_MG-2023]MDO6563760.1 DNA-binding domain-containing protein [Amphritea sp. 1_MG-2023]